MISPKRHECLVLLHSWQDSTWKPFTTYEVSGEISIYDVGDNPNLPNYLDMWKNINVFLRKIVVYDDETIFWIIIPYLSINAVYRCQWLIIECAFSPGLHTYIVDLLFESIPHSTWIIHQSQFSRVLQLYIVGHKATFDCTHMLAVPEPKWLHGILTLSGWGHTTCVHLEYN